MNFSKDLSNTGTKVKLLICEGLYHAYPYFPVEESRFAIDKIIEFIQ